nr:MAG TPA: hypothetical protein [Caudoviricetes sp.]
MFLSSINFKILSPVLINPPHRHKSISLYIHDYTTKCII